MTGQPARNPSPVNSAERDKLNGRETRARLVAAGQELILVKLALRCGGKDSRRYDLVYARYDQPAATQLSLTGVETWLGMRGRFSL
jgi:hypothetical protein